MAIIRPDELILKNLGDERVTPWVQRLDMELAAIEKEGYEHFMLKEVFEQPRTVRDCLRGRLDAAGGRILMRGVEEHIETLKAAQRIILLGCGTSWHAGLVAEYVFEELCRVPVEVEYASEFRYRNPVIRPGDVVVAISQSGETADTLVAVERAKEQGALVLGVLNVVGSSIARASHAGAYTHAGPEIGVASTKAFTAQLAVLTMMALRIGEARGTLGRDRFLRLLQELDAMPDRIQSILADTSAVRRVASRYAGARDVLYLGRGPGFPVALEGALKLKEISYIHAEGYPAAEMKHGPIALVEEGLPVVFVATRDASHEKLLSNIQEVRARRGTVIAVVTEGDTLVPGLADEILEVPACDALLAPLLSVIPLQLLAYHIGVEKGLDVDKPRNLAKSVTVE
jgi:glucosamine--fructose-6-phosphate aminotransferase (isomerizing)